MKEIPEKRNKLIISFLAHSINTGWLMKNDQKGEVFEKRRKELKELAATVQSHLTSKVAWLYLLRITCNTSCLLLCWN